jgi:hypothetical protein
MRGTLLALCVFGATSSAWASAHHFQPSAGHADWATPSALTCETVRTYVSMLGVAQARALALANGMTGAQERRARRCLATSE